MKENTKINLKDATPTLNRTEEEIKKESNEVIKHLLDDTQNKCENLLKRLGKGKIVPEEELKVLKEQLSEIAITFESCLEIMLVENIDDKRLFLQSMRAQGLISRLSHRIQRRRHLNSSEKFEVKLKIEEEKVKQLNSNLIKKINNSRNILKKDKEKFLKISGELGNEISKLKESVLTITSLVFMAFTFIQLNFVAFQNSKDYLVFDRLILFSGVNIFLILGVYVVFSMIKSIIIQEKDISPLLKKRMFYPVSILILVFISSISYKFRLENKPKYLEEKEYLEHLVKLKDKRITDLESSIENLEIRISKLQLNLEERIEEISNFEKIASKAKNQIQRTIDEEIKSNEERIVKLKEDYEDKIVENKNNKKTEEVSLNNEKVIEKDKS